MSQKILRRLRWWKLGGFLAVGVMGPLLHFTYAWSGENSIIAAFSAVNESVWEHMKIFYLPFFLVALIEMAVFADRYRNFVAVKFAAAAVGTALIPVLHYTYSGAWGQRSSAVDVAVFYVAAAAAFLLDGALLERGKLVGGGKQAAALLGLWALVFLFVWMTYEAPAIALFTDPVTGLRGV